MKKKESKLEATHKLIFGDGVITQIYDENNNVVFTTDMGMLSARKLKILDGSNHCVGVIKDSRDARLVSDVFHIEVQGEDYGKVIVKPKKATSKELGMNLEKGAFHGKVYAGGSVIAESKHSIKGKNEIAFWDLDKSLAIVILYLCHQWYSVKEYYKD